MAIDPNLNAHKAWIGYLQPVGLVVSPHALVAAQAVVSEQVSEPQQRLRALSRPFRFPDLAQELLGWRPDDLAGGPDGPALPDDLAHPLPEYGETLRPTYAVPDPAAPPDRPWLLLIQDLSPGTDLDAPAPESSHGWDAPPQAKFERLLRETGVPIGLLHNGALLRLVYAPRGETSGHVSFPLEFMTTVAGRDALGACLLLLGADRLFMEADNRRLPALLSESRKYQNEVSTRLAEQVLGALLELLRGFQAADEATRGQLLGDLSRRDPQHIYGGLLTVLLRLVFLLYAEDRGLMPGEPTWAGHYSVTGLYHRLREDAGRHPDTMDQRFGAWPWLLTLFRLVFTGGTHDRLHLPARHGDLFNPDEYPFLEGRPPGDVWQPGERRDAPRVPDGVLWRVLQGLLVLDGERLSYRSLDVEQIGSVYESMMGFKLERAKGPSVAVRPGHVVVDLAELLSQKPENRAKQLKEHAGCDLTGNSLAALKAARTPEDIVAALGRKQSHRTPSIVPAGSLYLQPGEERRKSGSHYTPRSLTGPIVKTTLRPVLEALGERPTPEQILSLKIGDPAMGSGAFLVEACRQLGDQLVRAWELHRATPAIPPDEDPLLHARRLVAQRCLYGVDKNPFAVDLAKLSLWLVTLAKDHPFTFLDHALKHGDSLVGLNKGQIAEFRWDHETRLHGPLFEHMRQQVGKATARRQEIHQFGDDHEPAKREALRAADDAIHEARLIGDAAISAFFSEDSDKKRNQRREEIFKEFIQPAQKGDPKALHALEQLRDELRSGDRPVIPFHWEIEFPEVFDREHPGFDCFVGNPPFAGKNSAINSNTPYYLDWLKTIHEKSHGNSDIVAHFFRRAFLLLNHRGCLGFVATNTISQGDTRETGLEWICLHGGQIYEVTRRLAWPGAAAVVVSIIHLQRGDYVGIRLLNEKETKIITAFLFHAGGHRTPMHLLENARKSFKGSVLLGPGFTFEDGNESANTLQTMNMLLKSAPENKARIFPYIGGAEVNSSPKHEHHRYAINFGEMSEQEARRWPDLMSIVERKVKPQRLAQKRESRASSWWLFGEPTPALYRAIAGSTRVLVTSQTSKYRAFAWLPKGMVYDQKLVILADDRSPFFATLQSRTHEIWASLFGSTMKDDPVYTPSDCFETFPFPPNWQQSPALEQAGKLYYDFRADLMVRNNEGLTATYNRFHDPDERSPDILKLRELHAEMDRAVLTAYGWTDLAERATCEFRLDYEDDDDTDADEAPRARAKKKPWRYRWPQDFHDEVLARLLDLNQQRAEEERLAGAAAEAAAAKSAPAKKAAKKATKRPAKQPNTQASLLPSDDD
ncbi:DNA methyltransferase [Nannocystis sp. SCPEA4]|uniref:Eco57I restriction-modification methylase domain-containing protein n=1 Tax=Nannocystis sp. SCPEA4 TaxID=2996787 RepID=UPI00227035EB|nr:DNA methyltransferase [Nannocystis sp. SCPEA4]MCY1062775.1 N-6 DNA methylase [Nannocystis sp. SCPEA4]